MNETLRTYDGAVALITGGASGIGRALAGELARRGATPILADRQLDLAQEVAAQIGNAEAVPLDVRDGEAFLETVKKAHTEHGRLDYFFNNAGLAVSGEAELNSLDDWYRVLDVNLRGVVHGIHAVYPIMLQQGFGHIVNTASMAGLLPMPGAASYGATKHAVVGLSKALRVEGAARGVRVSALCPGFIRTPILNEGGHFGKSLDKDPDRIRETIEKEFRVMEPDAFAVQALAEIARNPAMIIVPKRWRLLWWLARLAPNLVLKQSQKRYDDLRRTLEEETTP